MIFLKAYVRLNLGDDLFIKKICSKYENEEFCILADRKYKKVFKDIKNLKIMSYSYKKMLKKRNNNLKYKKYSRKVIEKISKKCDTCIYIGGSIFIEKEKSSLYRLKELKYELDLFNNAYIIGANFGPFVSKEYFEYLYYKLIPSLNHISFRDIYSYDLFKGLDNVSYAPDILFSLQNYKKEKNNGKDKILGISLIHHLEREELQKNYDSYLKEIVDLSIRYIKKGFKVSLLSFCSYEKDDIAINQFIGKIPDKYYNNISIVSYDGDILKFLDEFMKIDTIVATRFHSIVLGMKYCNKVYPICYSNKSINLLKDLGVDDYVTFNNVNSLSCIKSFKITKKNLMDLEKLANNHFNCLNIK